MKKLYSLFALLLPAVAWGQTKSIAMSELTTGSGMFFGAQMSTTTITVTVKGPSDRFLAYGFGTGMANGNDAIIWSTLGTGTAPLTLRDHKMIGQGNEPSVDAQQDWTIASNTVAGTERTIVATRALNTGDVNDVTFAFTNTTQNLFWAKSGTASNTLVNHGPTNRASGIVRNWVLDDITPPALAATTPFSPADNAVGVANGANLTVTFNENVALGTGLIELVNLTTNVVVESFNVATSPLVTVNNATVTINPTNNLTDLTGYFVRIANGAIKDLSGNNYAGFNNNTTWNFTSGDGTPPVLAATTPFSPADNAINVPVSTNLTVTFNENVQVGTGLIELFDATNTLVQSFNVATSPLVTITNATVTINPTNNLNSNTGYYVHIANGAIKDLAGNSYAGFLDNTTWNFTAPDNTAPALTAAPFSPADNAINVPMNTNLTITFNENVLLGVGLIEILDATNTVVESFNVATSPQVSVSNATVTIDPLNNLVLNTVYHIRIANGAIKDISGNNYAGFNDNTTWNFTIGDITPPVLAATPFSPADNAINVPVATNLTLTFNENVQVGTGLIELFDATNTLVESFNVATSPLVTVNNAIVTINPTNNLNSLTGYYIHIANGAIKDLAGNNYAGFTDNTTWNFTTLDNAPPVLIAAPFSPADNAVDILPNTNLVVTFNENVQVGTGLIEIIDSTNTVVASFNVATSPQVTVNNTTVTVNPANDLSLNKLYHVHIANGAIKDLSGNNYAGIANDTTWNFRTIAIDTTAPQLAAIPFSPADNSTDVPLNTDLTMNFNESVQLGAGWIQLFDDNNTLIELFSVNNTQRITVTNTAVVINPTFNLNSGIGYYVTVSNGAIKDLLGNSYVGFNNNSTWNFKAVGNAVGINDIELSKGGSYNWNGQILNILVPQAFKANLYDAAGKLVMADLRKSTNCSNLPKGIYFVRLYTENNNQTFRLYVH